jgi:hypothetical protein
VVLLLLVRRTAIQEAGRTRPPGMPSWVPSKGQTAGSGERRWARSVQPTAALQEGAALPLLKSRLSLLLEIEETQRPQRPPGVGRPLWPALSLRTLNKMFSVRQCPQRPVTPSH